MPLDRTRTIDLLRQEPLPLVVVGVLPVCLAAAQLLLAALHGTVIPSAAFAVLLVVFAAVATSHHAAACRLRRLEQSVDDR